MNAVQLVTIKSLRTLYKNGEAAERIELANVEEHNFDIVVQKGLYVVGDKAVYIQPDYCLPMPKEEGTPNSQATKLFLDFTMPDGDVKKSKLGKQGRIRAIKFNFQLSGSSDPVYSVGIMMPMDMIDEVFGDFSRDLANGLISEADFDDIFEVTKYEEPETAHSGLTKGLLPAGMYATDETNIKNCRLEWPMTLTGTVKVDGSSITVYYRDEEHQGICSRNLEKKCDQEQVSGYVDAEGNNVRHHYDAEKNVRGWMNEVTGEFFPSSKEVDTVPDTYKPTMTLVDDTFVKLGKPVLEKLREYCVGCIPASGFPTEIALRGELCGTGLKGSGNKNNPHSKLPQQIIFYAADDYSSGVTKRVPLDVFYNIMDDLDLGSAPIVFKKTFNSWDELSAECEAYFKTNLIEGIVVKNDDATFSAKFMNSEYDARKD
jgi:RNA ligase (TIGR02306 family)